MLGSWLRRGAWLCLSLVAVYLAVSAFEPIRTNWGDPWSDGNAMTSGRYFAQTGFIATAFTPILDVGPLGADSLRYIHYPPLPDLVAGAVQALVGPDQLAVHRLLAIVFSALALWFLHMYLRALWGDGVALLGIVLIASNLLFIQYADTVHHIPLYSMTGFACLWAGLRWLDNGRPRALIAVAVATFLCFLASYDLYFFLPIMILATVWLHGAHREGMVRGRGIRLVLVVAAAGFASIAVKNGLVIWAVGFDAWRADVVFQFFERATSERSIVYKHMAGDIVFWRLWRFDSPLVFVAILVQLIGVVDRLRGRRPLVSIQPLILLGAALPFLLVFSQLVVEQYHPLLLLLPFAAVAIAQVIRSAWASSRLLAAALLALYLGWQAWQFALFDKTFLRPADVAAVTTVLERDRHPFILSNIFVDGPVRYLWDRHLLGIPTDLPGLRAVFERSGKDSPVTIVQLRRLRPHMYDKGLFAYFGRDRRLPWIARPDYFRDAWGRRFDERDREMSWALADMGRVVHASDEMIVRSVTDADLERLQRSRLPMTTPTVIDFESETSDLFKVRGISPPVKATPGLPGFAWLSERVPSKLVFTLRGFEDKPVGSAIRTSELHMRLPADRDLRLVLEVSSPVRVQRLAVKVNGHVLGSPMELRGDAAPADRTRPAPHPTLDRPALIERRELAVPATALRREDLQTLELEFSNPGPRALRLHRLEITPATATN